MRLMVPLPPLAFETALAGVLESVSVGVVPHDTGDRLASQQRAVFKQFGCDRARRGTLPLSSREG